MPHLNSSPRRTRRALATLVLIAPLLVLSASTLKAQEKLPQGLAPKEMPRVPPPDAAAAQVPPGYRVELVVQDLIYPTSVEFDGSGNLYVAEAGYSYGDLVAPARILRIAPDGRMAYVADQLNGPITDLLWHSGRLYISHRGKISALEAGGAVRDLVTGLPSYGDHHNNQLTVGPDGKIYFGQGTATNSGVVGIDNLFPYLWLAFHPDVCDIPVKDIKLRGETFMSPEPLNVVAQQGRLVATVPVLKKFVSSLFHKSKKSSLLVRTGAFQPFGYHQDRVAGQVKASGTILRMNPDGSGLEVYAWGFRNPFGVMWSPDGKLYAADNGYDERGFRPIANAEDNLWLVRQDAWYGWPDYSSGIPVTDKRFRSTRGKPIEFLLRDHPPVEKPLLTMPKNAGVTKMDFSRSPRFGFEGQMFLGQVGAGRPVTAPGETPSGFQVVRVNLATRAVEPFFRAKETALGPRGMEYMVTPGPKRPVDVRFSPDGNSLYVADIGAIAFFLTGAGPGGQAFPGTGAIWRITREGTAPTGPPAGLSPLPGRGRDAASR